MDGIGSPGGRGYRAPYGANNRTDGLASIIAGTIECRCECRFENESGFRIIII